MPRGVTDQQQHCDVDIHSGYNVYHHKEGAVVVIHGGGSGSAGCIGVDHHGNHIGNHGNSGNHIGNHGDDVRFLTRGSQLMFGDKVVLGSGDEIREIRHLKDSSKRGGRKTRSKQRSESVPVGSVRHSSVSAHGGRNRKMRRSKSSGFKRKHERFSCTSQFTRLCSNFKEAYNSFTTDILSRNQPQLGETTAQGTVGSGTGQGTEKEPVIGKGNPNIGPTGKAPSSTKTKSKGKTYKVASAHHYMIPTVYTSHPRLPATGAPLVSNLFNQTQQSIFSSCQLQSKSQNNISFTNCNLSGGGGFGPEFLPSQSQSHGNLATAHPPGNLETAHPPGNNVAKTRPPPRRKRSTSQQQQNKSARRRRRSYNNNQDRKVSSSKLKSSQSQHCLQHYQECSNSHFDSCYLGIDECCSPTKRFASDPLSVNSSPAPPPGPPKGDLTTAHPHGNLTTAHPHGNKVANTRPSPRSGPSAVRGPPPQRMTSYDGDPSTKLYRTTDDFYTSPACPPGKWKSCQVIPIKDPHCKDCPDCNGGGNHGNSSDRPDCNGCHGNSPDCNSRYGNRPRVRFNSCDSYRPISVSLTSQQLEHHHHQGPSL
eukprot:sb/3463271/